MENVACGSADNDEHWYGIVQRVGGEGDQGCVFLYGLTMGRVEAEHFGFVQIRSIGPQRTSRMV